MQMSEPPLATEVILFYIKTQITIWKTRYANLNLRPHLPVSLRLEGNARQHSRGTLESLSAQRACAWGGLASVSERDLDFANSQRPCLCCFRLSSDRNGNPLEQEGNTRRELTPGIHSVSSLPGARNSSKTQKQTEDSAAALTSLSSADRRSRLLSPAGETEPSPASGIKDVVSGTPTTWTQESQRPLGPAWVSCPVLASEWKSGGGRGRGHLRA